MDNKKMGWVSIYRSLFSSAFWLSEKFTRPQAWVDLIGLANWQPDYIRKRGIRLLVQRGQVGWSMKELANRWRWSPSSVKLFLLELKDDSQIDYQMGNVTSLITIVNYEEYQNNSAHNETQNGHRPPAEQSQDDPNNKDKEVNNEITTAAPPNKTGDDWPFISMPELAILRSVPGYTFDLNKDFEKLGELSLEFPMVDVMALLKNWKEYITDTPFKKKSSPRAQLRNQFIMAKKKGMHKKESDNGDESRRPDAGDRIKEAEEAFEKQEGQPS